MSCPEPHLINITCSDDRMQIYTLGIGVLFSDLTDEEKETVYLSAVYLEKKYCKEIERLREELAKKKPQKVRVYVKKVRKSK